MDKIAAGLSALLALSLFASPQTIIFALLRGWFRVAGHERGGKELSGSDRFAAEFAITQSWFPATEVLNLCFQYGLAGGIWAVAIHMNLLSGAVGGIVLGIAIAFTTCSYPIFAKIDSPRQAQDRHWFINWWVIFGFILGGFGLLVWGIRGWLSF